MKVMLINPPCPGNYNPDLSNSYPLGLLYIASVIEKNGIEVVFYDCYNENNDDVLKKIKSEKPDYIGIQSLSTNRYETFKLIDDIYQSFFKIKIFLGGPHASTLYNQILTKYCVDGIFLGEAENSIINYLKAKNKNHYKNVQGFAYKLNETVMVNRKNPVFMDIDEIPMPAYHLIDFDKYRKEKYHHIITSRGCPFNCNFCAAPIDKKYRRHSIKRIINEIKELQRCINQETIYLYFHDDYFLLSGRWVEELCKEIQKLDFNVSWITRGRLENVSLDTLKLMNKAGCRQISFGLESGSEKVLKFMNKKLDLKKVDESISKIRKSKIDLGIYVIIGYPGESLRDMYKTFKLLKKCKPKIFSISFPGLFPGTELYEQAKNKGDINDDYWFETKNSSIPIYSDFKIITLTIISYIFKILIEKNKLLLIKNGISYFKKKNRID